MTTLNNLSRRLQKNKPGFTIVELLIVIVVIAILAAITIVAYNGIQQRARASEASAALSQAKKKLELYKVDNSSYPASGNLSAAGVTDGDVSFQYTSDGSTYCITGTATNVSYKATETTSPASGGCPGHGQGGVAAITNMIVNPSAETNLNGISSVNATISRVSEQHQSGSYSIKIVPSTSSTYTGMALSPPGNVGTQYTFSAYIYSTFNQSINFAADGYSVNTGATVGPSWQRLSVSGVKANSNPLYVRAVGTSGIAFYVDSIMVTEGSTTYAYADGNSTNWAWSGAANNSTSIGPPL